MNQNMWCVTVLSLMVLVPRAPAEAAPVGTAFTYQGELESGGMAVDEACDFQFSLWSDPLSVNPVDQVGVTIPQTIDVAGGRFTTTLNFGVPIFNGEARWLQIAVCCPTPPCGSFTTLTPRQEMTPVPYAIRAGNGVGPPNAIEVNSATGDVGIGTDSPTAKLDVIGNIKATGAIQSGGSIVVDGSAGNERISSTGNLEIYSEGNRVLRLEGEVTSAVDGTGANVVGGWHGNSIAPGVVGATICGGGGIDGDAVDVSNLVNGYWGTVGGGYDNSANGFVSTIGGGLGNTTGSDASTVGGGRYNDASGGDATVGGGSSNEASGQYSTVGGGQNNTASGSDGPPFVGDFATVGGGSTNTASGDFSTVPGGFVCEASGNLSFAAGYRAKANHNGTFVWADDTNADFASTAAKQFLIRASGGVGIGTASPQSMFHLHAVGQDNNGVSAPFRIISGNGAQNLLVDGNEIDATADGLHLNNNTSQNILLATGGGNVGIGFTNPTFKLHLSTNSAAKPTSNTWTISSDERLKKNIEPIEGSLEKLLQLRGVTYQWIDPASQGGMDGTYTGMIAQDVELVFPEWVSEGPDGYKSLTVIGFEALAVEALRDLRAEKDAEIAAQRAQLQELTSRVKKMEAMLSELSNQQAGSGGAR